MSLISSFEVVILEEERYNVVDCWSHPSGIVVTVD